MTDADKPHSNGSKIKTEFSEGLAVFENLFSSTQSYLAGITKYINNFNIPSLISMGYFQQVETRRLLQNSMTDNLDAYFDLLNYNLGLMNRGIFGAAQNIDAYAKNEMGLFTEAMKQCFFGLKFDKIEEYTARQARLMDMVVNLYPDAIEAIEPEFGFHFESGAHTLADETDRFFLYRIAPSDKKVKLNPSAKPILILPPYVLGANILSFLPGEQRSYAHCYANRGFPTYIRILKDIRTTPALQIMTGEDDAVDTKKFCEAIVKAHKKPVTLNGYCQGGFSGLCNLLSGQLDELVDAFITCVSPMDGTRSTGLSEFLQNLPLRFNDLAYGTKTLPNGNQVADGKLMGWVYKLKSIEQETPISAFFRDLMMFARQKDDNSGISKTAAALNYWLNHERFDLPLEITRMSFASYNTPITEDGTLPVRLFDGKLNLKRLKEKGIPWLICYGIHDDLVEKETALAPLDYIDAEVSPFPKGHVAIATSWSHPESACALHTRFGEGNYRGPVLFHMDLDKEIEKQRASVKKTRGAAASRKKTRAVGSPTDAKKVVDKRKKPKKTTKPASENKAPKKSKTQKATRKAPKKSVNK